MAQRKKKALIPWPENVWYTKGTASTAGLLHGISAHLHQMRDTGQIQQFREFDPQDGDPDNLGWWGFDAGWCTEDGARIRARLVLVPDRLVSILSGATRNAVAADRSTPLSMSWSVTAEADRPWRSEWPSPILSFFPRGSESEWACDSTTGQILMHGVTAFNNVPSDHLAALLERLASSTWYTTVITHDQRPFANDAYAPLSDLLPNSMFGRVLEIRVYGNQDQTLNELPIKHRVSLPWGGAVILPSSPRKDGWPSSAYGIKKPDGDFSQLLQETSLHVTKYFTLSSHFQDRIRDSLKSMQDSWELPGVELEKKYVLDELERAKREIDTLRQELTSANRLAEEHDRKRREAEATAAEAQDTVLETMRTYREHPLAVREAEARAQAEDAFSSQEAAELLADDLTAQVAWLRRQLAQVPGRSYGEEAPKQPKGPESWQEMAALAQDLMPHVLIGKIWGPLKKLEGHQREPLWLRRTWEVLEALDAYAAAKQEHGPDVLPHFHAYLNWPGATALVSKAMYVPSEVKLERGGSDLRTRQTRLFDAEGVGKVFMGAHFRVGGARPPAPRMHVYDDTCGPTGKIHVGYLGPHLPNWSGV